MTFGDIMDVAASALVAQRTRLTVTASNLANAETTRTAEGGPYRRRDPVFVALPVKNGFGSNLDRAIRAVEVSRIQIDDRDPIPRLQPGHPDADEEGIVQYPRVNVVEEMTNMMSASRSFEASILIMRKVRQMSEALSQIGR